MCDAQKGLNASIDIYNYRCRDGYSFDPSHLAIPVFEMKDQAINYIMEQLAAAISNAEVTLRNAQEILLRLKRSLKVYQKYQLKHEAE